MEKMSIADKEKGIDPVKDLIRSVKSIHPSASDRTSDPVEVFELALKKGICKVVARACELPGENHDSYDVKDLSKTISSVGYEFWKAAVHDRIKIKPDAINILSSLRQHGLIIGAVCDSDHGVDIFRIEELSDFFDFRVTRREAGAGMGETMLNCCEAAGEHFLNEVRQSVPAKKMGAAGWITEGKNSPYLLVGSSFKTDMCTAKRKNWLGIWMPKHRKQMGGAKSDLNFPKDEEDFESSKPIRIISSLWPLLHFDSLLHREGVAVSKTGRALSKPWATPMYDARTSTVPKRAFVDLAISKKSRKSS